MREPGRRGGTGADRGGALRRMRGRRRRGPGHAAGRNPDVTQTATPAGAPTGPRGMARHVFLTGPPGNLAQVSAPGRPRGSAGAGAGASVLPGRGGGPSSSQLKSRTQKARF